MYTVYKSRAGSWWVVAYNGDVIKTFVTFEFAMNYKKELEKKYGN